MKVPFNESANTMAITCSHILHQGQPILYISHDANDGMWQFLCGNAHTEDEARVVSLLEIFELDNSIAEIANLPCGMIAERKSKKEDWIIRVR